MKTLTTSVIISILSTVASVSAQHCCTDLFFAPISDTDMTECFIAATDAHRGLEGVANLVGAQLISGRDGLYTLESEDFGCFHDLNLGKGLTSSEKFSPELDKWIITIFSRDNETLKDSLALGKDFIQVNRR